jgi:hypothetical protein
MSGVTRESENLSLRKKKGKKLGGNPKAIEIFFLERKWSIHLTRKSTQPNPSNG